LSGKAAGNRRSKLDGRRTNAVIGVATIVVVAVLVAFAVQLHATQTSSRDRVITRYQERAQMLAALTEAALAAAATPGDAPRLYGGRVDDTMLDRAARKGGLPYVALLDGDGAVLAASRGVTPTVRARLAPGPAARAALAGRPAALGDIDRGTTVDLATGFPTASGRRVLVTGAPVGTIGTFLASYLRRVPTRAGTAYVLDGHGVVVGARDPRQPIGVPVAEADLATRGTGPHGDYGDGRYYIAEPIRGTTWRVVLTSSSSSLFQSVSGARKWLPWAIYAALGLAALAVLALMRRLLAANVRLRGTNALLRRANELARSNAELEQFASIASHDLQEPLRKVQTFAAQLNATEADRLSEQGQDFLRRMSDASGRMRALIDDLLAFSRVSTKGRPFVEVRLGDVAAQALGDLEVSIEESGATVTIGTLPEIEADPVQMRQLLLNLMGNAVKFRRPGVAPAIDVAARVDGGVATITVRDNGLGFDPQFASRIFRAFERLHGTSAYPGTGIGLALCRKIAERHHGTITAGGREGEGATFTVVLPLRQPADPAPSTSLFPEPDEVPHALA
jgi:signal transduction histidine kinase